jgi:micrococcal nuclease
VNKDIRRSFGLLAGIVFLASFALGRYMFHREDSLDTYPKEIPMTAKQDKELYRYKAIITNVVDGDTFDVSIDLGFGVWVTPRVRLLDVGTPEMHTVKHTSEEYQKGVAAREFVVEWLQETGFAVVLVTRQDKGARGRYLAKVERKSDGADLGEAITAAGHVGGR